MNRPSWDDYFMEIATVVAKRATCPRKSVGAVIVKDHTILATGYNGAPRGLPHCTDELVGCMLVEMQGRQSCVRSVHAEANAIAQAARTGADVSGAAIYTTASPCWDCAKLIVNSGIRAVIAGEFYSSRYGASELVQGLFKTAHVNYYTLEDSLPNAQKGEQ